MLSWLERLCVATALVSGSWVLLHVAQADFYRRLPVPVPPATADVMPADAAVLPGDGRGALPVGDSRSHVAAGTWVARLEAPTVRLVATVIEGSTDDMLARAAGHIEETALPGMPGNVGIAGHRGTTFRPIQHLRVGDPLRLSTRDATYEYRVVRTFIVDPRDVYVLDPTTVPSLTLVTCYPFTFIGPAPRRYIIRAELTEAAAP